MPSPQGLLSPPVIPTHTDYFVSGLCDLVAGRNMRSYVYHTPYVFCGVLGGAPFAKKAER